MSEKSKLINVAHYEAFSATPGQGNPAGVVFAADPLTAEQMQSIAKKVGFNETAFILKSNKADLRIRYFTPGHEMNLCGHGTIASIFGLMTRNNTTSSRDLSIETLAGILDVHYNHAHQEIKMAQAPAEFKEFHGDLDQLADSLGLLKEDIALEYPVVYGSTGIWTLILPIKKLDAFWRMKPDNRRFKEILTQIPTASIHPVCLDTFDKGCSMHGRHFSAAHSGTIEDPVTGTASGVMGAYYISYIKPGHRGELLIEQGNEIGRKGIVRVSVEKKDSLINVSISGKAVYVGDIVIECGTFKRVKEPGQTCTLRAFYRLSWGDGRSPG
ncbi:PhzF family phenazine biosynthesis protein [Desulfitobacterium chlororespirans]|uniref:Phenazine biosynthesis protein PhzF family n=1 Tax=Desulfitobacterium chlororespirans DSM 11544 TaxID=1121395 RepID=A0A1M7SLI1_9FIRM|nr:PhzF family phenazine biosynthesis protein [Desulfitobacterium chlororespirans]SHN59310.1 phenazine biosynthesis protein PhzF family [Desulfitobacterium chlororespirans DSM 11544]